MTGANIYSLTIRVRPAYSPLPRGVAQPGSAPGLGPGCREFESLHPDHLVEVKIGVPMCP